MGEITPESFLALVFLGNETITLTLYFGGSSVSDSKTAEIEISDGTEMASLKRYQMRVTGIKVKSAQTAIVVRTPNVSLDNPIRGEEIGAPARKTSW